GVNVELAGSGSTTTTPRARLNLSESFATRATQEYVPGVSCAVCAAGTVTIHASSPSCEPVAVIVSPSGPRNTYERDHPSEGGCQGGHDRGRHVSPAGSRAGVVVGSCAVACSLDPDANSPDAPPPWVGVPGLAGS